MQINKLLFFKPFRVGSNPTLSAEPDQMESPLPAGQLALTGQKVCRPGRLRVHAPPRGDGNAEPDEAPDVAADSENHENRDDHREPLIVWIA